MTDGFGPTIAKRRLSRRLSELRIANGYTANQVCDKLDWGRGKVGRFEANSWKLPEMSDIRDLLRIYEVDEAAAQELTDLARTARVRSWWREYGDVFADSEYPGYEADATGISAYLPLMLPGLLQTRPYIEAHMKVGTQPPSWRRRALEARLRRQEILDRPDGTAPDLVAVITEASLMYRWGSRDERRAQVQHLVDLSMRPTVELRLQRFADGPHPGMSSQIHIFDFLADEPSMIWLEHDAAVQEVNTTKEVATYALTFKRIYEAALDAQSTTAYLKDLAQILE